MASASASIKLAPYCSTDAPVDIEVKGIQVGELLVHRGVVWFKGSEPRPSKYWTATHTRSGLSVNSAMPSSVRNSKRRQDILDWADKWQKAPVVRELLRECRVTPDCSHLSEETRKRLQYGSKEAGWRL